MANGNFYDEQHDYFSSPLLGGGSDPNFVELKSTVAGPNTLGFPRTPDMTTPEQKIDAYQQASAAKQGGMYDPNTRTMTFPDKAGQRAPQGGAMAGGSNVFIPSDPKMRINAGGGGGASAPDYINSPVTRGALTGQVEDLITGDRMPKADWESSLGDISRFQGGHKQQSRERENMAIDMAASSLGQTPLARGATGAFPQTLGHMQDQQVLARAIMQTPASEEERFAVAPTGWATQSMTTKQILDDANNGSVLHPASDVVSMGTNWQRPDDQGMSDIMNFQSKYGDLPEGLPYSNVPATDNLAAKLTPNLLNKAPETQVNLAPKDVKVKPKGKR